MGFLTFVSGLFGWIYTFCWSASFYPQLILNLRRKSTSGTTVDFPFINVIGFVAYLVSNASLYYSPVIRSQYAARHNNLDPTVQFNDIVFALHASVISTVTLSQYLLRSSWGFARSAGGRPSRIIVGVALGSLLGVFGIFLVVVSAAAKGPVDPAMDWCELDVIYAVSYVKLLITLVKFTPQILANYSNQSTRGWSIWQVTLDFAGGVLSTGQQAIDSYLQHDWSGITGNPVKFALGNVSMVYDCIFLAQHYILYRGSHGKDNFEGDALLGDEEQQRRRRLD
ncbi:cystinosin [Metarhizium album ARSEF 1941]|uniref:Cystinosin n=1 Tax=Metarhizium album (strain ARSEF 1941) TaxID=1081103 RepID=A0A0B2WM78_METAS|nr:cystinosin [Metarhizium album ARSEF 1941]KHN94602.1 cystinosin [Metarhizium album ARSEF 1941]